MSIDLKGNVLMPELSAVAFVCTLPPAHPGHDHQVALEERFASDGKQAGLEPGMAFFSGIEPQGGFTTVDPPEAM
jgi:hypothetical protein